jgi:DNA invertase Pin-like site-specific DNA recombinase
MSGSDADRPGLWDAIFNLKRGYVLLIRSWDRLARDSYLSEIIQMQVKKKGCSILSISQEDTSKDNPESKLVRTILLAIAEYQRQIIRARTRAAMKRYQREGRRMTAKSKLPYGWMIDPDNDARMIPHPEELKIIEKIKKLDITHSKRAIAKILTTEGIQPRLGGRWGFQAIYSIMRRSNEYNPENKID